MNGLSDYQDIRRKGLVEGASPHALTLLLFDGALSRLKVANTLTELCDMGARHTCLDRSLAIVQELQGALRDPDTNPLSGQLFSLYMFVTDQILKADRTRDNTPLASAIQVLSELRSGWAAMEPEPMAQAA
jgi:flagellar protein FliS